VTIRFQCAACNFGLSAPDDKAGVSVKCPKCKAPVVIPLQAELDEVLDVLPATADGAIQPTPAGPAVAPLILEAAPAVPTDFSRASIARGPQANCPFCGCPGWADKVSFTWWGGLVGPALFSHVKCRNCRREYNGKTGKPNDKAIALYIGISVGLAILVLVFCAAIPALLD
jgi:hypothetical protein